MDDETGYHMFCTYERLRGAVRRGDRALAARLAPKLAALHRANECRNTSLMSPFYEAYISEARGRFESAIRHYRRALAKIVRVLPVVFPSCRPDADISPECARSIDASSRCLLRSLSREAVSRLDLLYRRLGKNAERRLLPERLREVYRRIDEARDRGEAIWNARRAKHNTDRSPTPSV